MLFALLSAVFAGALTVLAPCSLTLLPVIVGGSLTGPAAGAARLRRTLLVAGSLGASVFAFTLLLKVSAAAIGIEPRVWQLLSGLLLAGLGLAMLAPSLWDRVAVGSGLSGGSARRLAQAGHVDGWGGAVLTGAALGPVFTSCSPLFGYLVVTVIPAEPGRGLALLSAYVVGLVAVLLAVALTGDVAIRRLRWAADPHSPLRAGLGLLLLVVGVLIAIGLMLDLETWLVENSPVRPWEWGSSVVE